MSDDFDAAVASTLQPNPAQAARTGFSVAADTNPDAHAEALRVARRTGVPVDTVTAYPQEMKRQAAVGSIDFDTLAKTSPATAALLADVEKAKVAHDDVEGLANAENALKAWKGPAPSFASVAGGLADALKFKPLIAGLRLAFNDAMFGTVGDAADQVRRADLVRKAGQAQAQQDYTTPAFESSTASGLYSGGVSLLQNLPGVAASIMTGSPAPGLALAGLNSAAPAYGKYSARGATAGDAALGAGMEGSIEVLTEALPMGFLVKNFGRVGFGEFMTGLLGREIPTEIIATLVQNMTDSAIANPDVTMTDYLKAQPDAVYQTILATLVQSAAMGGAGKIVQVATGRAQAAKDAERGGEYLDKLNQAIAASKVLQRDPETFEQFVASAAEGAPVQAVFIDANALLQSGVADQVIAASPAVASQIQQAMQTGGQIAIPIDEYAAKIAPTDAAGALLDHIKIDPEGFSRAEAQQYMQSHAEELRAEVERAMEDRQGHDAFRESADVVRAEIRKQLDDTGRFTGPANDAYATLVGNFFAVQAAKMGITPQELYARYPLNVTAQAVGGAQFDQAGKSGNVAGMDDAKNVAGKQALKPAGDVEQGGATPRYTSRNWQEWYELPQFQSDDQSSVLFNHGRGGYISQVELRTTGVFDGLFALRSPGLSERGSDVTAFRIPNDKMLYQRDLDYELDYEDVAEALIDVFPRKIEQGDDSFDEAWKAIVEDRSDFESLGLEYDGSVREDSFMDILGYKADDAGEASWFAQKLRGRLAAKLGYQAVQMDDENGSSWYIAPGVKSIPLPNEQSTSESSDVLNGNSVANSDFHRMLIDAAIEDQRAGIASNDRQIDIDGRMRPVENSNGQLIHPTEEGVRNFWKWFGDSKVVDEQGRPLVVYHGTTADFAAFATNKEGIHFGTIKQAAMRASGQGKNLMPVYLRIERLQRSKDLSGKWTTKVKGAKSAGSDGIVYLNRYEGIDYETIERAENEGFNLDRASDAAVRDFAPELQDSYIVFRPEQIKSATGNSGTFDLNDPNILHQGPRAGIASNDRQIDIDGRMRPVENSNGQLIHPTEEGVRNFWKWFGDSKVVDAQGRPLVVYHGSQKDFSAFSTTHLGRLTGAQSARLGFFFTSSEKIASGYASALGNDISVAEESRRYENSKKANRDLAAAEKELTKYGYQSYTWENSEERDYSESEAKQANRGNVLEAMRAYKAAEVNLADSNIQPGGVVYPVYVRILDPDITDQEGKLYRDWKFYDFVGDAKNAGKDGAIIKNTYDSANMWNAEVTEASDVFIVFSSEQIKSAVGNTGTFDPNDPNILHQGPRGAFSPASNTITLLKAADLSTFLHETGHFFLEAQLDMAARLAAVEDRTEGENEIIRDANALLAWFGLRDIHEWNALDFEEKRDYHERFARGFEAYLFEGKAPSIELQGVFQRFRAWLVNIYRDLKALNVELTDEVRGVMDRMIATGEQIQLAEQGRSMMPLFRTAEQAGMTPEEFAAYQALGAQATADAVEDLQARGLRDLQWLRNARGREIARLQKQGETQRANLRMEVRREVMSQPVYRAWQFLTGKISEDDKLVPPERFKSDPDIVDPGIDSLFSAIAKLGGINRESAAGMWGVKPEDKPASGLFGKPVLRAEGKGLTVDQMAEKLAELGYLKHDENSNTALRDFEDAFRSELGGSPVYSTQADYDVLRANSVRPGDQVIAGNLLAGRLDRAALAEIGAPAEAVAAVKARRMTADNGLHPDIVAELFGFSSGDELVRTLAEATPPKEEIDALTDQRMMEQFGELATPEAIARSADKAIHNDARARMIATEINALAKATGRRKVLASAAREYAAAMIARLRVRDIRPGQYASAEAKAARAAQKASQSGDLATSAAEKRNELVNNYATRAAYDAQEEVAAGVRYLKKFDSAAVRKALTADYADQIDALLERFDLRTGQSLTAIDKRAALADWIKSQQDAGIEPDIPPELLDGAFRKSFKDMTVEEFRGLLDAVKQIEHLGRLKQYLLTAKGRREYEAARNEIVASIEQNAEGRTADTRTPTTRMGRALQGLKRFGAAHIKAATWARIMDGGKDGGPMWEYFVRVANERGDMETTMRAGATKALSEIMTPVFAQPGRMGGKGQFFPTINRSLNREARIALALNVGNEGNLQRLLGGEGWTVAQIMPVLQSLTPQELVAVQQVWDHFESYRPQIAAKERRIYGKEPAWVVPGSAVTAQLGLRGGYYPIKYDPAASQRAEEHADAEGAKRQLQGAYTTATTRRSFTKARVEEVSGRPLLYTLTGLYSGVNDVIHDLAWHEWLIDTNRLLRSKSIDAAIRNHYGPEVKGQLKTWAADIAEGEKGTADAVDAMLGYVRQSVSVAGLGFNVVSAAMQPLGITQSIVRVGPQWVGRGISKYIAHPISLTREVNQMSSFMENRARTRSRELNELRNQVQDQSAVKEWVGRYAYFLMMRFQQAVDVPTWWGAYERALAEGNDEERAISLADQGVIDSQGSGLLKDQAAIERVSAGGKLFTVFYSFMNTALNLGVQQGMTERNAAKQAANYALLYLIPPLLGMALKAAITPGDSGDDDPEKIARKLLAAEIDYLMGLFVGMRELSDAAKTLAGANDMGRDYQGPAGLRLFADIGKFAMQAHQGDLDDAFRKAFINLMGDLFGLPAAQINRTITGTKALAEGKTANPASIAFGFQEPR